MDPALLILDLDEKLVDARTQDDEYGREVVAAIFPAPARLAYRWYSDRCTRRYDPESQEHHPVKDLKKVKRRGFSLDQVLMVDDTGQKLERTHGNLARVRPFERDPGDEELRHLARYLGEIRREPNDRAIEKRSWRGRPAADG